MQDIRKIAVASAPAMLVCSQHVLAYVGPGLGAGTIGVIAGLVGSILLALFAFFWYPIKRSLLGKGKETESEAEVALETCESTEPNNNPDADGK